MRELALERTLTVFVLLLLILAQRQWKSFRRRHPDLKFTFRITDIWASMLGFLPSIVAFAHAIESTEKSGAFRGEDWVLLLVALPSQIFGAFLGFMHAAELSAAGIARPKIAITIIFYTLAGILVGIGVGFLSLLGSANETMSYCTITAECAVLLVVFSTRQNEKL